MIVSEICRFNGGKLITLILEGIQDFAEEFRMYDAELKISNFLLEIGLVC